MKMKSPPRKVSEEAISRGLASHRPRKEKVLGRRKALNQYPGFGVEQDAVWGKAPFRNPIPREYFLDDWPAQTNAPVF